MNSALFSDWVNSHAYTGDPDTRHPFVYEDASGDLVEFFLTGEEYNAERLDGRLTIYRGVRSGQIVGGVIKGITQWVSRLLDNFSGFHLWIDDNRVELHVVILAAQLQEKNHIHSMRYREVFQQLSLTEILSIEVKFASKESQQRLRC